MRKPLLLALLLACGCNAKPVAPQHDPHERNYRNVEEGFHFEAPAGWGRLGIAHIPPGPQEREALWVKYRYLENQRPTFFRVSFIDLPETTTVAAYLKQRPPGPEDWRLTGEADKTTLDGVAGMLYRFSGNWDHDQMVREVVAIQRGRRVLFFTGIYPVKDVKARDAIHAAYKTVRWEPKNKG